MFAQEHEQKKRKTTFGQSAQCMPKVREKKFKQALPQKRVAGTVGITKRKKKLRKEIVISPRLSPKKCSELLLCTMTNA